MAGDNGLGEKSYSRRKNSDVASHHLFSESNNLKCTLFSPICLVFLQYVVLVLHTHLDDAIKTINLT